MALPATDSLNVSHQTELTSYSSNWTNIVGAFRGLNGTSVTPQNTDQLSVVRWNADTSPGADNKTEVRCIFESTDNCGPVARLNDAGGGVWSGYLVVISTGDCYVFRYGSASDNAVGAVFTAPSTGTLVRLEVATVGGDVECRVYYNNSLHATRTDSTAYKLTSGSSGGFFGQNNLIEGIAIDDFTFDQVTWGGGTNQALAGAATGAGLAAAAASITKTLTGDAAGGASSVANLGVSSQTVFQATLVDYETGTPIANWTGLRWSWWPSIADWIAGTNMQSGSGESTDGSGLFEVAAGGNLTPAVDQGVFLITDFDGTNAESARWATGQFDIVDTNP